MKIKEWCFNFRLNAMCWIFQRQIEIISNLDPKNFSVEEIARFFFIPNWLARTLLNQCVREGDFENLSTGNYKIVDSD